MKRESGVKKKTKNLQYNKQKKLTKKTVGTTIYKNIQRNKVFLKIKIM